MKARARVTVENSAVRLILFPEAAFFPEAPVVEFPLPLAPPTDVDPLIS